MSYLWKLLMEISSKIKIFFCLGSRALMGDKAAVHLARNGSTGTHVGPEPSCGIAKFHMSAQKSQEWWVKTPDQRQVKKYIKLSPGLITEVFQQSRAAIRMTVGRSPDWPLYI